MNLSEFGWHLMGSADGEHSELHLRRGGASGVTFAKIGARKGKARIAVIGLHRSCDDRARIWCESEDAAINVVEEWLVRLLNGTNIE
ncbi:hypothetical protein LVB87_12630 [Lysobacter sp. KIS68-7]|uniref:hypothetical protein n=1 Tax=Lysobacter sp. KIS68-7 TaxID=2904252 RepID=UPI001E2FBDED|nr:hypothetical protein [Lysobacter sp. KIS68-7]UHQ19020.1 hypothetical protein LVB87_12630 [Lysobacter sp. KIS68-7]